MIGLVYVTTCVSGKAVVPKNVFTTTTMQQLKLSHEDSPPSGAFKMELGSCRIKGFGLRLDPFSTQRRKKLEYGLMFSDVVYTNEATTKDYNGYLFAISYNSADLMNLASTDDILKKTKFISEIDLSSPSIEKQRTLDTFESQSSSQPTRKKPKILFADSQASQAPSLKKPEDSTAQSTNALCSVSLEEEDVLARGYEIPTTSCDTNSILELLQKLSKDQDDIRKQNDEILQKLEVQGKILTELKTTNSGNSVGSAINVFEIADGYIVSKAAYAEACRHRLVQKAALPLFEALFTPEEKVSMRIKGNNGQQAVDASRLQALYKTLVTLPSISRLSNSDPKFLSAEEQRLVRQEIGNLLNNKRQRQKKKDVKQIHAKEPSESQSTNHEDRVSTDVPTAHSNEPLF